MSNLFARDDEGISSDMIRLTTQQDFRRVRQLPFCYLCGRHFTQQDNINRDHLPPSALFDPVDRDVPLILRTHVACNKKEHTSDEFLGQFISITRRRTLKKGHRPLDEQLVWVAGRPVTASKGLNIHHFIRRCVRGFHATLYRAWLPSDTMNEFHPPLRGAQLDGNTGLPTDELQALLARDLAVSQHALFARVLKQNRFVGNTDSVISRNGKCIYECVWDKLDNGTPICIFGLKIYEWQEFDEQVGYPPRGCVGMYSPKNGRPDGATRATELEFPFPNKDILDPFGP